MQTDDESLTLSKWPFYIGDVLLVATALAIAILGDWNLSDWQVASCVIAVALGAGLFVLPFVVEYYMRISEHADERSAETRQLQKHLQSAEMILRDYGERMERIESGSGTSAQGYELLVTAVDQKLALIDTFKSEQAAAVAGLQKELNALAAGLEQASKNEALDTLSTDADALSERLEKLGELNEAIEGRMKALEVAFAEIPVPKAEAEPVEESPSRAPRKRRKSEPRLLSRAIKEKQDSASSAVHRIIHSKNKREESPPAEATAEEAPVEAVVATAVEPEIVKEVAPEPDVETPAEELILAEEVSAEEIETSDSVVVEEFDSDIEVSLGAELIEDETLLESEPVEEAPAEAVSEPAAVEEPEPVVEDVSTAEAEPPVDLFGELEAPATRQARVKKDAAVLTVSILIGIGNKPFLRGSGGGLNWDTGIPMDFEEIGKWRWIAPTDLDEPVELLVYRNDEDPDRKGKHILAPGQKLEVSPVF